MCSKCVLLNYVIQVGFMYKIEFFHDISFQKHSEILTDNVKCIILTSPRLLMETVRVSIDDRIVSDHLTHHLRYSDEAVLLRKDRLVGQIDGHLDRLVDRAVTEVNVLDIELKVSVRNDGVDGEGHGTHLEGKSDSNLLLITDIIIINL